MSLDSTVVCAMDAKTQSNPSLTVLRAGLNRLLAIIHFTLPLVFAAGAWVGAHAQISEFMPGALFGFRNTAPYLAWWPLLLTVGLFELIMCNQEYLLGVLYRRLKGPRFFFVMIVVELLLVAVMEGATWVVGGVFGLLWTMQTFWHGLTVCGLSLWMLAAIFDSEKYIGDSIFEPVLRTTTLDQCGTMTQTKGDQLSSTPAEEITSSTGSSIDEKYDFSWERVEGGLDALAGMRDLKESVRRSIRGFRHFSEAARNGESQTSRAISSPSIVEENGILLFGPPGNGKTTIAARIAGELNLPFVKVGSADLTSKWVNESAKVVKALFQQAKKQPCVVFIDELDGIAQSRANSQLHGEDRKLINTLLAEIDTARKFPIVLIAATNFLDQIDAAVARAGRFDFRIEVGYPDYEARFQLLCEQTQKLGIIASATSLREVASLWEQRSIVFMMAALKKVAQVIRERDGYVARADDFKMASREAGRLPSALAAPGPLVSEIALAAEVREQVNSLIYRLENWEFISKQGGEVPRGVILTGPPGAGKTYLVQAMARQLDWHIFEVNAAEASRNPLELRKLVDQAIQHRPSFVFLDEADEVLEDRRVSINPGITNEFLKIMDGAGLKIPEVVFIASTNRIETIDKAALRPGRFDECIRMDPLTGDDLRRFVEHEVARSPARFTSELTPCVIAGMLRQSTPAEVTGLLRQAVNFSISSGKSFSYVDFDHLRKAFERLRTGT